MNKNAGNGLTGGDTSHNTNGGFAILVEHRPDNSVWVAEASRSSARALLGGQARVIVALLPSPFGRLAATMSPRRLRNRAVYRP
jgi:hypothetical protein